MKTSYFFTKRFISYIRKNHACFQGQPKLKDFNFKKNRENRVLSLSSVENIDTTKWEICESCATSSQ